MFKSKYGLLVVVFLMLFSLISNASAVVIDFEVPDIDDLIIPVTPYYEDGFILTQNLDPGGDTDGIFDPASGVINK